MNANTGEAADSKLANRIHEHIDCLRTKLASKHAAIRDAKATIAVEQARLCLLDWEIEQLKLNLRLAGFSDQKQTTT